MNMSLGMVRMMSNQIRFLTDAELDSIPIMVEKEKKRREESGEKHF
jgi:hypothetical protein